MGWRGVQRECVGCGFGGVQAEFEGFAVCSPLEALGQFRVARPCDVVDVWVCLDCKRRVVNVERAMQNVHDSSGSAHAS